MQFHGEPDLQASQGQMSAWSSRKRKPSVTRKVTIRLTENLHYQLETATERPGVGKSMVVEAALERFLTPEAPVEELVRDRFDEMGARFDRLEHDLRMLAETVALHARYHLSIMPPLPLTEQREACVRGDERFRVLAEQVNRRVRMGQPLMQETIDRLNEAELGELDRPVEGDTPDASESGAGNLQAYPEDVAGIHHESSAAAGEGGGNSNFRRPLNYFADRRGTGDGKAPALSSSRIEQEVKGGKNQEKRAFGNFRLILSVFLPFAAGYYLSYLFRTINASIAPALASEFGLDAAATGLLASVYFLVFAGAQIPIGVLLDRFGPRRVQSVLLVLAAGGATLYGMARGFPELLMGRALIGLGVAASLMAGIKAIVLWFPKERVALANGWMIMLGSLGAVTATAPTAWLLNYLGWRDLFEILTIASVATAGLVYCVVPDRDTTPKNSTIAENLLTLRSIFTDPRFLRIAPLSATCIGSSWALQSLWAAPWLVDVEGSHRQGVAAQLFVMALGISLGALVLGMIADRLRRHGIRTEVILAAVGVLCFLAELALILRAPLPPLLPWCIISVMGAATVLSYAVIADYFSTELAARANGALNLLHFSWAFVVQCGIGVILAQWSPQNGHYPIEAYQSAFAASLAFQAVALIWFAAPWLRALSRQFLIFFLRPHQDAGRPVGLAAMSAEGTIIEIDEGADW